MKTFITLFILSLSFGNVYSQCENYCLDFEDTTCINQLQIDTSSSNNSWKIAHPQKPDFDGAYSQPLAIVTDSISWYKTNDSSVFFINNPVSMGDIYGLGILQGRYNVQTDSLKDFGKMEFTADGGQTWVDLLNSNKYESNYNWWTYQPVLTGNSNGWKYFEVILSDIGSIFDIKLGDTITYRFTFISDDIQDNLGGLMFDNICFSSFVEGISEQRFLPLKSTIFPNPSKDNFNVEFENPENQNYHIAVYNSNSVMQFIDKKVNSGSYNIDAKKLLPGIYFYKLTNPVTLRRSWGKFIVIE
ncbi:MAG: hypothetical protein C0595_13695 [Marinilabiliales bacterium]|nr:MAG: hypothetical protein C0595_13695 [Marinilabiliales bacterium]